MVAQLASAQSVVQTRLDSLFTALDDKKQFNGNVLVADKGQIIFEKSYGFAQLEPLVPLNTHTMFELASVSKQFTAMGIVQLQKQGKLQYDDLLSQYIPELSFYKEVTVRQLLQHTSGLPDYMELMELHWDKSKIAVNADVVALLAQKQPALLFTPNSQFEYGNTNYALLASIIEKVSKQSYGDYLQQVIFKPLQMTRTMVYRSRFAPQNIDNYAKGYEVGMNGAPMLPDALGTAYYTHYLDGIVGDGMVNSTLQDLLKWDRALYANKLVNEADKKLIFGSVKTTNGKDTDYGFGWGVGTRAPYGKIANHTGGWAGYSTLIERIMDHDKTIIILQNYHPRYAPDAHGFVRKILFNQPIPEANHTSIQPTVAQLQQYAGVYTHPDFPLKVTVFEKEGVLMAQATGQGAFATEAFAGHRFTFSAAGIVLTFDVAAQTMRLQQGNNEFLMKKQM